MEKDKKEKLKQAATLAGAAVLGGSTAEAAILLNATADEIQEPIPTPPIPEPAPPVPEPVPPVPEPVPPVPEPVNPDEPQPQGDDPDPTGLLEPITIVGPDGIDNIFCEYGPPPIDQIDQTLIQETMYAGPDVMGGNDVAEDTDICIDPIDLYPND